MNVNSVLKKRLFAPALLMILLLNTGAAEAQCPFIRGDVNGDGSVDPTDVVFLINLIDNGIPLPYDCEDAADVEDDGDVDVDDKDYLVNHLYLGMDPPPAPFPDCGTDPTADALNCNEHWCLCEPQVSCVQSRPKTWYAVFSPGGEDPFVIELCTDALEPLAGLDGVYLDFTDCGISIAPCEVSDFPDWPLVYGDPSDENGEVPFYIPMSGDCPQCSVDVYVPDCGLLARVALHTYDVNDDGIVTPLDWNSVPDECVDFNADGDRDGTDLSMFSSYLWSQCPGSECDLLISSIWTDPETGYSPGELIDLHFQVANRNQDQSCALNTLALFWSPLGAGQDFTEIVREIGLGVMLDADEDFHYTLNNFEVPDCGKIVLRSVLYSDCCDPDSLEYMVAYDIIRQCPPDLMCLESRFLTPPSYSGIELLEEIPEYWTFGPPQFSGDGDTLIIPFCTSDMTEPGTVGSATFVFLDAMSYPIDPPITLTISQSFSGGDCNGDCMINPVDVVWLVNYVYKNSDTLNPWHAGNVYCPDGQAHINPVDVVYLVNYVYRPPAPPPQDCPDRQE